jgi:murein L,D-transpeptidase YcbB/YkuD
MVAFPSPGVSRRRLLSLLALPAALPAACGRSSDPSARAAPTPALRGDQVELLLQALAGAPSHGFLPAAFPVQDVAAGSRSGDATAQRTLFDRASAYAGALHGHAIALRQWPMEWDIRPAPYDGPGELAQALQQDGLKDWLAALPPPSPAYQGLRGAYQGYLKAMVRGGWQPLDPSGPPDALRQRLALEDPALAQAPQDASSPGAPADAVQRAQARYGLKPTGQPDADLIGALNVPAPARAAQIRANLERLRWLPRTPPDTRIEVNTAAAILDYFENGSPAMSMLAAAGKPGDDTPMLISKIDTIELNPPWKVPDDIAEKELFPKARRHPGYFAREGFVVHPPGQSGELMQKPGSKNALGQVKFEFPNPFQVYLHDTPARSAFESAHRSISHGCVRLERALDLAVRLLSGDADWPPDRLSEALASRDTAFIKLARPVPVGLYYFTAFPSDGQTAFRDDVYGWDEQLLRLLDAGASSSA